MKEDLDILTLPLNNTWDVFKVLGKQDPTTHNKARYGIKIKFDIINYLEGRIKIKPKTGDVQICSNQIRLPDLNTELLERETLMKEWLLENMREEEIGRPRETQEE